MRQRVPKYKHVKDPLNLLYSKVDAQLLYVHFFVNYMLHVFTLHLVVVNLRLLEVILKNFAVTSSVFVVILCVFVVLSYGNDNKPKSE